MDEDSTRMMAVLKRFPQEGAEYTSVEIPNPNSEEILVKVKATSICGTDSHIYQWNEWAQSRITLPRIFGHEFSGEVVEVGENVDTVEIGDYVSGETHIPCYNCYHCKTGQKHICQNVKILGVDTNGSFAEYVKIPQENAWKNSKNLPIEIASIQEPLGNAVHTVLAGDISGKTVAILGCGPIGLMAIAVSRISGASKIFATDINSYRLRLAEKMKADFVLNAKKDVVKEILEEERDGVDVVLEMSGSPIAIKQGFKIIKKGGRYSFLGLPNKSLLIDVSNEIVFKGITLQGISGRVMFDTWFRVKNLLDSKILDLSPIITHKFLLKEFEKGMELMKSGNCGKVVLYP